MSMTLRIATALALVTTLTNCATTPIPTSQAPSVPRERVLRPDMLQSRPGYGQIIVKRDEGFSASACNTRVFAAGVPIAEISTGEKVVFYLPAGEQMIGALATGICIGGLIEARVIVTPGKPITYRAGYGSSGEFQLQPTAF